MEPQQTPNHDPDGVTPAPDAVTGLELLAQGIAMLQTAPISVLSDGELRAAVAGAASWRARLDAAYLHLLAGLDSRHDAVPGAATGAGGATFLIHAVNMTPKRAAKDVRAAHALDVDSAGITPERTADPAGQGLPRLGMALAGGQISKEHVDVAVRALGKVPDHLLTRVDADGVSGAARVDAFLTDYAVQVSPDTLRRIATQLLAVLDPAGSDSYDPQAYRRRHLSYRQDATGMLIGSFALDPAAGAEFQAVIEALVKAQTPRPDAGDTPDGDTPDGETPEEPVRDERSAGQRRADALHQLCRDARARTSPSEADDSGQANEAGEPGTAGETRTAGETGEPREHDRATQRHRSTGAGGNGAGGTASTVQTAVGAQIVIVATAAQIADALAAQPPPLGADGLPIPIHAPPPVPMPHPTARVAAGLATDTASGAVDPGTLALMLCNAVLNGVVLDSRGAILSHGRARRRVTPAQSRALVARDRGCVAPGCTMPPGRCEAHHVVWWRHGGPTDIENLALLCARHHAAVHTGHWQIQMVNGLPWTIAPAWADPTRTPRRNSIPTGEDHAQRLGQHLRDVERRLDRHDVADPARPDGSPPGSDPLGDPAGGPSG